MWNYSEATNNPAKVPAFRLQSASDGPDRKQASSGLSAYMFLCCAVMFGGFVLFVLFSPVEQSLGQTLLGAAPLLACLGAHLVMHRIFGKSCHAKIETSHEDI